MSTVDDRIVQLKFDNKQFEAGVSETLKSLENLKKGLELKDQQSGLTGLESNVSKVASRFSDLGIIGVGALASIGTKAMDAGIKMAKALTIDPVTQGFSEYELKMGSIQTIMAGTGESLETVNKYLNDLNTYSDKTIYSFSDMTSNIGKFTNAGVGLKDAVSAIQGISNVAAISGANANDASRAMYNFSQALSSGFVKLIDWKSIENANMATAEFKTQLLEAAVNAGTLRKNSKGMYVTIEGTQLNAFKNFNDSLQDQWMTTEVLTKTLSKYADETTEIGKKAFAAAQDVKTFSQLMATLKEAVGSGWAQSFEIIVGDFDEAKTLFTNISNIVGGIIGQTADARNEILKYWKDTGGRKYVLDALANTFNGLMAIVRPFSEALSEVFTPAIEKGLFNFSSLLLRLSMPFKNLIKESDKLKRTFRGLFAILDIAGQIISALLWPISEISKMFHFVSFGVLDATASMGDFLYNLSKTLKESKVFQKIVEKAFYLVLDAIKALHEVARPYLDMMVTGFRNLQTAIQIFYEYSKPYLVEFRDNIVLGIVNAFKALEEKVQPVLETVKQVITNFFNAFKSIELPGLSEFTNGILTQFEGVNTIGEKVRIVFDSIAGVFGKFSGVGGIVKSSFKNIASNLISFKDKVITSVSGAFKTLNDKLTPFFTDFKGAASKVIEWFKGLKAPTWLTEFFDEIKTKVLELQAKVWPKLKEGFAEIGSAFADIFPIFVSIGKGIGSVFQKLFSLFDGMVANLDTGSILAIVGALGMILVPFKTFFSSIASLSGQVTSFTGIQLLKLTTFFSDFFYSFQSVLGRSSKLTTMFQSSFAFAIEKVKQTIEFLKPYMVGLGKIFADIGRAIKDFYNGVKPSLVAFSKNVLEGIVDAFESLRDKVKPGLNTLKTNIINFFNGFKSIKLPGLTSFTEGVKSKFEPLGNVADGIQERFAIVKENFGKLGEGFKKIGHGLGVIGGALGQTLDTLWDYFTNMMSGVTFDDVMRVLSTGLLGYIVLQIRNFVKSFKGISDSSSGVLKGITGILDGIRDSMKTWQDTLKADILKKIAIAIGILSVSLLLLSLIDPKKLVASLAAITTLFVELFGAMSIFEVTMGGKQFDAIGKVTRAMVVLSIAILILSAALTKMAQVEPDRLNNAVAAIGKLMTMMVIYAKAMSKNKDVISESSPMGLIAFATSLVIMASVVTKLGQLDPASLIQGLLGVTALLNLVSQFARKTDLKGLGSIQGPEIVAFALALIILSKAVKIFGDMEPEKLAIGLLAVGVMLGEIAAFTQKLGDDKRVFEAAASMVVIGVALLILTKSVQALGMMDMGQLSQGLFGIGIALTILAVALGALPEDALKQAAALVVTALALKKIMDVVTAIGQLPWQVLALGLGAFAVALALIVGAAVIMKNLKITLTLQQFGLAVLLVGAGILAAGIGVGLFVSNLLLLAAGMVGIEAMIIGIKIAIVQLMPFIIQKIGEGLVALAGVIGDNAPVLIAALVKMWIAFVDGIMATVPYTLEQLGILITMLVDFITNQLDTFIQLGFDLLIGLLKGIRDNIGEITTVSIELVNEFINGVAEKIPEMIQTGINFIVTYINSLAEALTLNRDVMIQAFENLINAVVGAGLAVFGFSLPDFTNSGTQTIKEGVIKGINDSLEALKTAIKDLITKGINSIKDKWEDFKSAGKNLVDGLIQGIKDKLKDFTDAVGDLGQTAIDGLKNVLGIHSPSTKFAELGKYAIQGFINGVASLKDSATSQVKEVGNATLDALKRTMDFVSNLANSDMSISPLVTPVIDMSNIQSGTKAISNLLSGTYGLNVGSVVNKLPTINGQNGSLESTQEGSNAPSISFTQNNYSPSALSRLDIYRQTQNQLIAMKGVVNAK